MGNAPDNAGWPLRRPVEQAGMPNLDRASRAHTRAVPNSARRFWTACWIYLISSGYSTPKLIEGTASEKTISCSQADSSRTNGEHELDVDRQSSPVRISVIFILEHGRRGLMRSCRSRTPCRRTACDQIGLRY
jgi:hypothetical protein